MYFSVHQYLFTNEAALVHFVLTHSKHGFGPNSNEEISWGIASFPLFFKSH